MRQNVPLRKSGSVEAESDRASRSIDEWLDAAVAEQARRSSPRESESAAPAEPYAALPPAAELSPTRERTSPATAAKSSTALGSMTSWIERAQEELAEVAMAPAPPAASYNSSRPSYDALSSVERLDTGLGEKSLSDAQAAQEEAFRSLENRIREIAGRLDTPRATGRKAPRPLEDAIVEIRARQAALDAPPPTPEQPAPVMAAPAPPPPAPAAPPAPAIPQPARELLHLPRADMDVAPRTAAQPAPKPAAPSGLDALKRDIERVHGSMAALATRSDLGAIERMISELSGEIAAAREQGGSLAPVEADVEALQIEVQRLAANGPMPTEGIGRLARDIDIVSHKLDIVAASGIDPSAIDALSREVAEIRGMLGGMAMPADINAVNDQLNELKLELARMGSRQIDSQDFASLRLAFEEMRDALSSGPAGSPSLSAAIVQQATKGELQPIASMLVMLIEKIERLERHSGDPEMLDQIERQIAGLSATIGSTASRDPGLSDLSHAMNDLMNEVASWRDGTVEIAEQAARSAVAQTIEAMRGELVPSALEAQASRPATGALGHNFDRAASRREDDSRPAEAEQYADQPLSAKPEGSAAPSRSEAVGLAPDSSDAALRRLNEALLVGPILTEADRPLPRAPENEVLLEPGAGRPRSGPQLVPDPENAGDQRDIKASFIAAARRAAQAAAADADKSKGRPFDRPAAPAEKGRSPAKIKAMLDRLRRPLLVSAAALVVAIGGYRLLTELTTELPSQLAMNRSPDPALSGPPVIAAGPPMKVAALSPAETQDPTTTQSVLPKESAAPAMSAAQPVAAPAEPAPEARAAQGQAGTAPATASPPEGGPQKQALQLPPSPANTPAAPKPASPDAANAAVPAALKQAATNGDPAALYELAVRTMDGRGVARDPRAAVALFEKAGEKNLAPAQYRAGNAYEKGIGVPRDVEAARRWYQRAAENGNTRAMHNLAVLMAEGAGGKPDYTAAMNWFQKAAEHGVRDSQFNLAVLFARGLGTQQDLVRSYTWFAVAAGQGDDEAAKKRDEVAARLQPADLARAKGIVERWRATPANAAANEPPATTTRSSEHNGKRVGRA
jgi:localization factor PodJL